MLFAAPITQVTWKKSSSSSLSSRAESHLLAIASEDHSLKIVAISDWIPG